MLNRSFDTALDEQACCFRRSTIRYRMDKMGESKFVLIHRSVFERGLSL